MLPNEIRQSEINSALKFISPQIILIHGSQVSKIRHSSNEVSDLDLIIITWKYSFWPLDYLCNIVRNRLQHITQKIEFDISIESPFGLISHVFQYTSLGKSIFQGFSILYPGDSNAT